MKIGILVPGGVDRSGRVCIIPVLLALIERLARKHTVLVINLDRKTDAEEYELFGARVANFGPAKTQNRWARTAITLRKLISALRAAGGEFDVLHAFWLYPQGTLAVAAGAFLRIPVVVSIGGGELVWLPKIQYGGMGTARGRVTGHATLRLASAVSAPSRYALRGAIKFRSDAQRIPTGVDTSFFAGSMERPNHAPWRILHVAGLNEVKNQETLLKAIQHVAAAQPGIILDCIGIDTLNGRMQALAQDLGIADLVRFHGTLTPSEILPFYQRAHLFLQSSLHESMGAAVLEASAAGVPIVGTNVGILEEMAPKAAVAVPINNPSTLAQSVIELLDNPQRRESLGRAAQEFSRTYNATWTAGQFEEVYRRVVGR